MVLALQEVLLASAGFTAYSASYALFPSYGTTSGASSAASSTSSSPIMQLPRGTIRGSGASFRLWTTSSSQKETKKQQLEMLLQDQRRCIEEEREAKFFYLHLLMELLEKRTVPQVASTTAEITSTNSGVTESPKVENEVKPNSVDSMQQDFDKMNGDIKQVATAYQERTAQNDTTKTEQTSGNLNFIPHTAKRFHQ